MSVYVDQPVFRFHGMLLCHMVADTEEELHVMADKIGVNRKWFQSEASTPHYDICKSKRALAIKAGAINVDRRAMVNKLRDLKQKG